MIFKNINTVFPLCFYFFDLFFFSSFCCIRYVLLNVISVFQLSEVLNVFAQQANVIEVEVSVEIEQ